MARVSFRIRRNQGAGDAVGVGSYVRGTDAIQTTAGASSVDQDSALRSEGIILVTETTDISTFSAYAVEYNAVLLEWTLQQEIVDVSTIGSEESGIIGVVLVYSKTGAPETVLDGQIIAQGNLNRYLHQNSITYFANGETKHLHEPEEGKWAYYTLFAYVNTDGVNGSYYYDRLASLEVIVPKNYGSTDVLWDNIPTYYREEDLKKNNQLYRFLSIFGFEADRTRTLIDTISTQYDPLTAEAVSLNYLTDMVGLEVTANDIGMSKVRSLLYDVGYLRRNKGTLEGTSNYLKALSGSQVDILYNGASAAPYYTIRVHAERANLIADPRFITTDNTTWQVYSQNGASVGTSPAEGITLTAGSSGDKVAVLCKVATPASVSNSYYMSAEFSTYPSKVLGGFWSTTNSWSTWTATDASASISVGVSGRYAYEMAPTNATGNRYAVLLLELSANQSITVSRWMVEPNKVGQFFDGASVVGGYLYQSYKSDYSWSGTNNASYSLYTTNKPKLQNAIQRLMPEILPVTLLGTVSGQPKYSLLFDWIPGKTS